MYDHLEDHPEFINWDNEEETEVLQFMAEDLKIKTKRMKAGIAREHDFPFLVPYIGDEASHSGILKAAKKIHAANSAMPRFNKFLKFLSLEESQDLNFLKNKNVPA